MSHQESYYKNNEAYAEHLAGWDAGFYAKYADSLKPSQPGARVLDVGCGVGQVVARLNEAIVQGVTSRETRDRFAALGADVVANSSEEYRKFILAELAKWSRVIREAGVVAH